MSKDNKLRLMQAIDYLKRNDIDIFSRTDIHYKNAIYIASGCELDDIHQHVTEHRNGFDKDKN